MFLTIFFIVFEVIIIAKVIESNEVIKNIINRLEKNNPISLIDNSDNSKILLDEELIDQIKKYYKSKLLYMRWLYEKYSI